MDINTTPRPGSAALRRFRTPIRGHAFATPPPEAGHVATGAPAALVREPTNPADPLAVAVWVTLESWGPWRLGYLDRGVAARIAPRLDDGLELHAELEGWTPEPDGRWERPLIALWSAAAESAAPSAPAAPKRPNEAEAPPVATPQGEGATDGGAPDGVEEAVSRDARVERRLPGVRRRRVA